jgi:hypothetical protein
LPFCAETFNAGKAVAELPKMISTELIFLFWVSLQFGKKWLILEVKLDGKWYFLTNLTPQVKMTFFVLVDISGGHVKL